jgi:hypothetical protein
MDDSPAVTAEVVVVARKVRADRGEGLAGGAGVHESVIDAVGRGAIAPRQHSSRKSLAGFAMGAEGICETSPVDILDMIDGAKNAFDIAGRGCLVRLGEDEPRYARVEEIAARLEPHPDATMLLTAVSEAVERYDPAREAAILLEVASGYQVLILNPEGYDYVGGLTFEGYGLLGAFGL